MTKLVLFFTISLRPPPLYYHPCYMNEHRLFLSGPLHKLRQSNIWALFIEWDDNNMNDLCAPTRVRRHIYSNAQINPHTHTHSVCRWCGDRRRPQIAESSLPPHQRCRSSSPAGLEAMRHTGNVAPVHSSFSTAVHTTASFSPDKEGRPMCGGQKSQHKGWLKKKKVLVDFLFIIWNVSQLLLSNVRQRDATDTVFKCHLAFMVSRHFEKANNWNSLHTIYYKKNKNKKSAFMSCRLVINKAEQKAFSLEASRPRLPF